MYTCSAEQEIDPQTDLHRVPSGTAPQGDCRQTGISEAEIIRQAIDRHICSTALPRNSLEAWEAETDFIDHISKCSSPTRSRDLRSGRAILSTQVLGEFFVATTRTKRPLLTSPEAMDRLRNYLSACPVVDVTQLIVLEAGRGVQTYGF